MGTGNANTVQFNHLIKFNHATNKLSIETGLADAAEKV